jgi:hypothetical protein
VGRRYIVGHFLKTREDRHMRNTSATSAAPLTSSFAARINAPMPRGLRQEADSMSFEQFHDEFASSSGPLRLGNWRCTDAERPSSQLGPQVRHYQATLAVGDRIRTSSAAACGPVAALTEMLYERGIAVEMTAFHQLRTGRDIATFIRGSNGAHDEWAMGLDEDATQSALRAMIACANRLLTRA